MTEQPRSRSSELAVRRAGAIAGLWGFAEATLFFIVPDVWLTWLAFEHGLGKALRACIPTLFGALLGGLVLYAWGSFRLDDLLTLLDWIPGISVELLRRVASDTEREGAAAMLLGPLRGVPYKTYAAQSHAAGVSALSFLLWSVPARLVRFVLTSLLARGVRKLALENVSARTRGLVFCGFWIAFYAVYFQVMSN